MDYEMKLSEVMEWFLSGHFGPDGPTVSELVRLGNRHIGDY